MQIFFSFQHLINVWFRAICHTQNVLSQEHHSCSLQNLKMGFILMFFLYCFFLPNYPIHFTRLYVNNPILVHFTARFYFTAQLKKTCVLAFSIICTMLFSTQKLLVLTLSILKKGWIKLQEKGFFTLDMLLSP